MQYAHLPVALKTVAYDEESSLYGIHKEMLERELRDMDHAHVTRCFGFFVTSEGYKLVLERMDCSLQDVIGALSLIVSQSSNVQMVRSPSIVNTQRTMSCAGCGTPLMLFTTFTTSIAVLSRRRTYTTATSSLAICYCVTAFSN